MKAPGRTLPPLVPGHSLRYAHCVRTAEGVNWAAVCGCGWVGPTKKSVTDAALAYEEHIR